MKKIFALILISILGFTSCNNDDNDDNLTLKTEAKASFSFIHDWDGTAVSSANFNTIQYTNENGEMLSIEKLRYLISKVTFTKANGDEVIIDGYKLVDVTTGDLIYSPEMKIPIGEYTNVSFTFGFNNVDNAENYADLNSASFNVPNPLGGGYHYMQFDGKYINNLGIEQGFNYHAIRAVDNPGTNPTFPQDTFYSVDLGAVNIVNDVSFEVKMDISQWFKNPIVWDLNQYNQMLMPNSTAQIMMFDNGQNVFSLGTVTQ